MDIYMRIERACLPLLVKSTVATAVLTLFMIWADNTPLEPEGRWLEKLISTALVLAAASGFLLSATRVVRPREVRTE